MTDKLIMIGQMDNTMDHTFESANRVYGDDGISPTIPTACGGGHGEKKSNNGTQWYQQDRVYDIADVSPCIPAQIPGGSYRFMDIKKVTIYDDYNSQVSNNEYIGTITPEAGNSALRHNYKIVESVEVKQATKDGYISCDIGEGMRSELPRQYNTQRSSSRERTDMSNTNNGEYP